MLARLEGTEGSAGLLMNDPGLYRDVFQVLHRLAILDMVRIAGEMHIAAIREDGREAVAQLLALPFVEASDAAHALERVGEARVLHDYRRAHPEVTDLLVTGGDPMVMKTRHLRDYLEPLLQPEFDHIQTIRIGSKALTFWPHRFLGAEDADDLIRLLTQLVEAGKHVALMAHYNHWKELDTEAAQAAIRRIRSTGVVIRDGLYTSDTPEQQDGRWDWMRFSAAASPGKARAWSNLGWARQQAGDPDGARGAYACALALDPGHAQAAINLSLLPPAAPEIPRECGLAGRVASPSPL